MISHTTERFRKAFADLPLSIQRQAKEAYKQFQKNPFHPGLRFKRVHSTKPIYSLRIDANYRALGIQDDHEMMWFWIGSHDKYMKLLSRL